MKRQASRTREAIRQLKNHMESVGAESILEPRGKRNTKLDHKGSNSFIPLSVPAINGNEWKYVKDCLDTGWVSSAGSFVGRFEAEFAKRVGAKYAVATSSGTAALHVALLVAGVEAEDEVLVSTLSFIAPANAVRYVGAWPVFMDAEPAYWQMDPEKVADFLRKECKVVHGDLRNKKSGRRVKAILPVHILGHPVEMVPLLDLAQKYNLVVIEDAAESLGAAYNGRMVGTLGHVACFSFNGNKVVTTGGGGMVVTDNETWALQARYLTTQAKDDPLEFVHRMIGYNYRLTNLQAGLGCAQLERLEEFLDAKRDIAHRYEEALSGLPDLVPMKEAPWARSSYWLYTILVLSPDNGTPVWLDLVAYLHGHGIESRPLWQPLHRSPAHCRSQSYCCAVAEQIQKQALSLPSSVGLSAADQSRVIDEFERALASVVSHR